MSQPATNTTIKAIRNAPNKMVASSPVMKAPPKAISQGATT